MISDEEHVAADHYAIPISHADPRVWFYPDGFNQPAAIAYAGEREVFRWIQRPGVFNLQGAAWRPPARKVLKSLQRHMESGPS